MITVQEAAALGCTTTSKSCPNFMSNYLYNSTGYGGTVNDRPGEQNYGYWTMSACSSDSSDAWHSSYDGSMSSHYTACDGYGARAVVVVSK